MTRPRMRMGAVAAMAVVAIGLAACTDDDDDSTSATTSAEGADDASGDGGTATSEIVIANFAFTSPTVTPGQSVGIRNDDTTTHTVTADNSEFDAGRVDPGGTPSITAPAEPGAYAFHCEIHATMQGTLTVA